MEDFSAVSWIAVITGTVVSFMLGWLWYSPKLFGTKWAEGSGVSMDTPDKMPMFAMLMQIVALFLLAMVIGITATANALITAIMAIIAAAFFVASQGAFSQKSNYAIAVDFSYIIVAGIIMIICQGVF